MAGCAPPKGECAQPDGGLQSTPGPVVGLPKLWPVNAEVARVPPRYIQNPLLLEGRKFDVRSYLLIACTMPYMIFFGHGYARLTLSPYDLHSRDLSSHLTNQVGAPWEGQGVFTP